MVKPKIKPTLPSKLTVTGVDHFATRWMASLGNAGGAVFSPVGMWPLLAILADVATDEVRATLEEAIAPPTQGALAPQALAEAALELFKYLDATEGLAILSGIWVANWISLRPGFVASLPPGTVEVLSGDVEADKAAVEAWADKVLGGLMSPTVQLYNETTGLLASAITVNTRWDTKFDRTKDGRLHRRFYEDGTVRSSTDVTVVQICGGPKDDFGTRQKSFAVAGGVGTHDVYLVIGKVGEAASAVLAKGLEAVRSIEPFTFDGLSTATEIPPVGPGLTIKVEDGDDDDNPCEPLVEITTPSFRVAATTQLKPEVCGLPPPPPPRENDFPGIAKDPMVLGDATQQAVAQFTRVGFSAGALSILNLMGCLMEKNTKVVSLTVDIDRPFGFLAVEPESGLLLFSGWVTENEWTAEDPAPEEDENSDSSW